MDEETRVGAIRSDLILDDKQWRRSVSNSLRDEARFGAMFRNLRSSLAGLALPMGVAGGAVAGLTAKAVKAAMGVQESENLFEVSMGNMAASTRSWSDQTAKALGMNANSIRQGVGTFNVMLKSMGLGEEAAAAMSKRLTVLAYDMASFYNLDPMEAFMKLQAGMSGEAEPLKRLGILINEDAVAAFALKNGLAASKDTMTDTAKTAARFGLIMQATQGAQGDLGRTMGSATNQMRAAKEQMAALTQTLGTALIPTFTTFFQTVNTGLRVVTRLVELHPEATAQFMKYAAAAGIAASALGGMAFVGPYVIGPLLGIGKALFSVVMIGGMAAKGLAALAATGTGLKALGTAATGLGGALGVAGVSAGTLVGGLIGVVGVGYVLRSVAKGVERDFDRMYVKAEQAKESFGGGGGGGVFGAIGDFFSKTDSWLDKSGVAFTEFTGELLGGGGLKEAIRASNKVMMGSDAEAQKLLKDQWAMTGNMLREDVSTQMKEDFGFDVDSIMEKVKGAFGGMKEMAGGFAGTLRDAMAFDTGGGGGMPDQPGIEEIFKSLGDMSGGAAEKIKDNFGDAAGGVNGLNESLEKTQSLMGAKVFKAGTLGGVVGDTSRKMMQTAPPKVGLPGVGASMPVMGALAGPGMGAGMVPPGPRGMMPMGMSPMMAGPGMGAGAPAMPARRGYANNTPGALNPYSARTPGALNPYSARTPGALRMQAQGPQMPEPGQAAEQATSGQASGGGNAVWDRMLGVLERIASNTRNPVATVGGYG